MSVGKSFERELRKAFQLAHPGAYVERNPDRMTGRGRSSAPSPPDLLVNSSNGNYLIECKVVKGISIPLSRLSDHQHDYLTKYDSIGSSHSGYVAVMFYNGKRGNGRMREAWLVPITYWSQYQERHPRKSMAMKHLVNDLDKYRMHWKRGEGWLLPKWI